MRCWHCNHELIWGGDHDGEKEDEYDMVSNLNCPNCDTDVYIYHTFPSDDDTNIQQDLFSPDMWKHYCPVEEIDMEIGKGEECNWCGETE
tara:strand:+ start:275 stop:544 length:270 start_codon:yes stop_codon:yes gene_type:complete